jgi:hypothetical protein
LGRGRGGAVRQGKPAGRLMKVLLEGELF